MTGGLRINPVRIPLAATILMFCFMFIGGAMAYGFTLQVFLNLFIDNAFLLVVAVGMTFVIISGGIDLSVGSVIALTTIISAALLEHHHWPALAVIPLVLVIGALFGAFMGAVIHYFKLQAFIVTLAGMFLARGLCYLISIDTITISDAQYTQISQQHISLWDDAFISWNVVIALVLLAVAIFVAHYTSFGRNVYAIGGSERSAVLMGLPVARTKVLVYTLSGFCSALAGVIFTFYMLSGYGLHAQGMELDAIAAVVIGGTLLTGGAGYIVGTMFGVLILGLIQTLITFDGTLSAWWTRIVIGALLCLFCVLQRLVEHYAKPDRQHGKRTSKEKSVRAHDDAGDVAAIAPTHWNRPDRESLMSSYWPEDLERVTLRASNSVVELAPEIGGAIAAYFSQRDGERFDWLRPASPEALASRLAVGMASYPLIPFCNRIRAGRFSFGGREIVLPLNVDEPHVLHGFTWQRPWQCTARTEKSARLRLEHKADAWPWSFVAEQDFELEASALNVRIKVSNTSDEPMPIGIGHHPYVLHRPGTRLQTQVEAMWEGDREVMPTVLARPDLVDELRVGTLLAKHVRDNNFIGWQHRARVHWPAQLARLTLTAKSPLDFFVLYSPDDKDHFCIEGVSNCTDWLNLQHLPHEQTGGHILVAGDSIEGSFSLLIDAA